MFKNAPRFKFISGFITASLIFGASAVAVNVNNTPQGGYLLCVNNKSKVVTFPGTLKCPGGTSPIEIPGNSNVNFASENNTSGNSKNNSNQNNAGSGNKNCNLSYLQKNPTQVNTVVSQCSSTELAKLQTELSDFEKESENKIAQAQQKLEELKKKSKEQSGTATALSAQEAVDQQAALVADLVASIRSNLAILTAIVNAIAKKVKS